MNPEELSMMSDDLELVLEMRTGYATLSGHNKDRMRMLLKMLNEHDEQLGPLMDVFSDTHTQESFQLVCDYLDSAITEQEAQS